MVSKPNKQMPRPVSRKKRRQRPVKPGIISLSAGDKRVLTRLQNTPLSGLPVVDRDRAHKLTRPSKNVIERYTVSVNPTVYVYLPGTRRALQVIMIDTMRVAAERRIKDYLKDTRFLDRLTIYSTFGEIAFVGFMVATAEEVTELAEEILAAVHKGPGAIEQDEWCDMSKGIRLYTVGNALVLCGEKLQVSKSPPKEDHLIELVRAIADASSFTMKNRALSTLHRHGYIGPFTIQFDPIRIGRFVALIPLFLASESELDNVLRDRSLMSKVHHVLRVSAMPRWGDENDYYFTMKYLLICEFDALATDYNDWYDRLIQKIKRANINEFAVRRRIHQAATPISDIPHMQDVADQYSVTQNRGLTIGTAVIPGVSGEGSEIGLSRSALAKHILVMGAARTGKSTTLAQIASEAKRLKMGVLLVDGKGELIDNHGTITNPLLAKLRPRVIEAKNVLASPTALDVKRGEMALLSVGGLNRAEYSLLLSKVFDYLEVLPVLSRPNQKFTKINRAIILDELETLVGSRSRSRLYDRLETILTQAASKGNCVIPVLHHFPTERPHLRDRCENRIVHKLEANAHEVQEQLSGKSGPESLLYEIEARVPTLEQGTVFVSFVDAELNRLPPMQVQIASPATSRKSKERNHAKKPTRKK